MTILDYQAIEADVNKIATIPFLGREGTIDTVTLINQETKSSDNVGFSVSGNIITVSFIDIWEYLEIDSSISMVLKSAGKSLYRDIIIFDGRLDTQEDYSENEESDTGYVFG